MWRHLVEKLRARRASAAQAAASASAANTTQTEPTTAEPSPGVRGTNCGVCARPTVSANCAHCNAWAERNLNGPLFHAEDYKRRDYRPSWAKPLC